MSTLAKRVSVGIGIVAVVAVVGVMFWPDMSIEIRRDGPVTPGYAQNASPGRSIAEQMSDAFEAAANRVSPAVVPIYA